MRSAHGSGGGNWYEEEPMSDEEKNASRKNPWRSDVGLQQEEGRWQRRVVHHASAIVIRRLGREKMNHNPNLWLCYHVRNSTCIHMRAGYLNIYIYRRGRIYKEHLEKYNNRKA
jgi:hypothetical protein